MPGRESDARHLRPVTLWQGPKGRVGGQSVASAPMVVSVGAESTTMNAYPGFRAGVAQLRSASPIGPGLLVLSVIGAAAVFWYGLVSLGRAWSTPEYSHGPVIPLLSAYMFLLEMRYVPPIGRVPPDRAPGLLIVAAALLLGVLGNLVLIPDIVTYALILWIWGMVLTVFGLRRGWVLWPGVLHLVFMLPLPQVVYWKLSTFLQTVSSEIGVSLIGTLGIPVFLDGNIIDLGIYKLQVAEACSGLRYLFPIMSFSYVFGVLYTGPRWHKIVLFLAAAPVAVLMNSFRIGMIGVLVDSYGIEQAEGFLHAFEGWIIFIACIAILFGLAVALQWTRPDPQPIADTLELDFSRVLPQAWRFFGIRASATLLVAALVTLGIGALTHATPERDRVVPERTPLALFPAELGPWQAVRRNRLEPDIERVLGADDYLSITYRGEAAAPVDLFVAYYDRQTEGTGIHSPEVCIPGGGWEVSDWERTELPVEMAGGSVVPLSANRAVIRKGLERQLVLYWFEQRGRRMTNDYLAKAMTVWDALTRGRTDGALVRLTTPMAPGESVAAAEARLAGFLGDGLAELPRFIPN